MRRVGALACVAAMLTGGCGSKTEQKAPASLPQLVLPDLSHVSPSVRDQIQHQYTASTRKIQDAETPAAERAAAFGELGVLLMAAEYRQAADTCFENAWVLAPADVRWPYYLAHLAREKGDLPRAVSLFARVLQIQPDNVPALVWSAATNVDLGQPNAAATLLDQALSIQPRSVAALYWLGRAKLARRDYRGAADRLEQALTIDPQPSTVQYQLALAYRGLGDTVKAEAMARHSAKRDVVPDDPLMRQVDESLESPMAYEERGSRALESGNITEAAANFRKGLELDARNPALHHRLGIVLYVTGDVAAAESQFVEALRIAPNFAKAQYSLGVLLGGRGERNAALKALKGAVSNDPTYLEARVALGDVLRTAGQWTESIAEYRQCLVHDPTGAGATLGYAMALVHLERYGEARDQLAASSAANPDRPEVARALARLLAAAPDDRIRDGHRAFAIVERLGTSESKHRRRRDARDGRGGGRPIRVGRPMAGKGCGGR